MQAELQTALFHAFDTLNLQQMKSFNVPPVTLHGVGALAACGPQAQSRGLRHLFVGNDSNLLIVFYVQIMPDDFVMQLHRF
ncbi:ethanolamine utilization protein EutG [Klebsiella pneumoniae]|nr:ethanolamine utilization protein EutG [Klebsiella pneumoniae]SAX58556.1 ethanolamine utilization protein EutG [Klebsiella pneumoniae]SVU48787.1 ethanolamine utilization protein EutG [Klebsiella pneumoniae]SVV32713.1 ethanolamine utilization protein EutG [Klebsiella pneumoniae]SXN61137.1 ethanolamine utilization protein EutG [Klebsiella pneumoniae]